MSTTEAMAAALPYFCRVDPDSYEGPARVAFEAQAHIGYGPHDLKPDRASNGCYRIPKVNNQWHGWLACVIANALPL